MTILIIIPVVLVIESPRLLLNMLDKSNAIPTDNQLGEKLMRPNFKGCKAIIRMVDILSKAHIEP